MERIEISAIKPGIRFSKPVYFDDGKNMFIESGITVKPYHMAALTKWRIPFLLSDGHIMAPDEELSEEERSDSFDELDSVEAAEDFEVLEDVEDLDEDGTEDIEVLEEL
ncbi:MAG: hypothetical protein MJ185_01745 [Treponema sp.]|nr:hypothetical protein [Treponema sp.]